jgi:hypothetical protein
MLPEISGKGWIESIKWNRAPVWHCNFVVSSSLRSRLEAADTEADARAKMLIYLLENNLIPMEGVDG